VERVEAVQVSEFPADMARSQNTVREPVLSRALSELSRPEPDPVRPWAIASIATTALLFSGAVLAVVAFLPRFDALNRSVAAHAAEAQTWSQETAALKDQTHAMKVEVENLRLYIGSAANEDVIFLKIMIMKPKIDQGLARTIARLVHKYCELYSKDPNLVLAIMAIESDFNPKATSNVGAMGLMQVMPQWKRVLGIQGDLDDPETSIRYGLQVLGFYTEMYKDVEMALTAYNRGPGPVDMALMRGKDARNGYAERVLATYQRLKGMTVTASQK
jgi:soluble lytic murein transglycosylase-like protein